MNIPRPGHNYDKRIEDERNRVIEQADALNHKRSADLEIVDPYRIIIRSPDGSRWSITVDNAGALGTTSL